MAIDPKRLQRAALDDLDRYRDRRLAELHKHKNDTDYYDGEKDYNDAVDFVEKSYREMRDGIPSIVRYLDKKGVLAEKDPSKRVFDDDIYYDTKAFNQYSDSDHRNLVANIFANELKKMEKEDGKKESSVRASVARLLGESTKAPARKKAKKEAFNYNDAHIRMPAIAGGLEIQVLNIWKAIEVRAFSSSDDRKSVYKKQGDFDEEKAWDEDAPKIAADIKRAAKYFENTIAGIMNQYGYYAE